MYSGRPRLVTRIVSVLPATFADAVRTVADMLFADAALAAAVGVELLAAAAVRPPAVATAARAMPAMMIRGRFIGSSVLSELSTNTVSRVAWFSRPSGARRTAGAHWAARSAVEPARPQRARGPRLR